MKFDRLEPLDLDGVSRQLEPPVTATHDLMARARTQLQREDITKPSQTVENVPNNSARPVRVASQFPALARSTNVGAAY